MLYVIHGTDSGMVTRKGAQLAHSLLERRPDASVTRLDADVFSEDVLPELLFGQGLFASRRIVVCDGLYGSTKTHECVRDALAAMASSNNIFILLEGALDLEKKGHIGMHATKIQECRSTKHPTPSAFALPDALGARNTLFAWRLYREALTRGESPEQLHGLLFWHVKNMILAARIPDPDAANLTPFVYRKAKKHAASYTYDELAFMAERLVSLYHDARGGRGNLETLLERWILLT